MKIRNLKRRIARKIAAWVVAAGFCLSGSLLYAVDIPVGDPSFEDYDVATLSADGGYAYSDEYRPTSAWVDDLDHASGNYYEDDGDSNWLYTATYAEGNPDRLRPAPRTGVQAMHGAYNYSAQVVGAVFEAGMTYDFSLWAQGDSDSSDSSSRIWMYIFDGSIPFTEADSLTFARYAPDTGDFINRPPGSTAAESMALWEQITLSHTVLPGAPEIGNPVGVGFWGGPDGAVDDATLTVIPEPAAVILVSIGGLAFLAYRRRE